MIIPAIDIIKGEAVRLYRGDYAKKTVYGDPLAVAETFAAMGAKFLHIVDLDGAKSGKPGNLDTIRRIGERLPIQLGGGIRTAETVSRYLQFANRVILGTVAVREPDFVKEMLETWGPERILVGVDVRKGIVETAGWTEGSGIDYLEFIESLKAMGVKTIVATDILKDGTLTAPNWDMYARIKGIEVIVSGGVSCDAHVIQGLAYAAVIVGRAYYEGKVDLKWLLQNESSLA